jgi:hypothetical protein
MAGIALAVAAMVVKRSMHSKLHIFCTLQVSSYTNITVHNHE